MFSFQKKIPTEAILMLLYLLGRLINLVNLGFLFPFFLPEELLGAYHTQVAFGFIFSRLHFGESALKAIHNLKNKELVGSFFFFILLITTLAYWTPFFLVEMIGISSMKLGLSQFFPEQPAFSHLLFAYILLLSIMMKFCYISIKKVFLPNFLQNLLIPSLQSMVILFYAMGWIHGRFFLIVSIFFPYLLNLFLLLVFLRKKNQLLFNLQKEWFHLTYLLPFLGGSLFVFFSHSLPVILPKIDILLIRNLLQPSFIGLYGTVAAWVGILDIPTKTAKQLFLAHVLPCLKEGKNISFFYQRTLFYQFYWTGALFAILLSIAPILISSLPITYQKFTQHLLLVIGLGKLFETPFQAGRYLLLTSQHFLKSIWLIPVFFIGLGFSYLSIIHFHLLGAAYANLLTVMATGVLLNQLVYQTFQLNLFSPSLYQIGTFVGVTLVFSYASFADSFSLYLYKEASIKIIVLLFLYLTYAFHKKINGLKPPSKSSPAIQ